MGGGGGGGGAAAPRVLNSKYMYITEEDPQGRNV